jgi:hypothetical protein
MPMSPHFKGEKPPVGSIWKEVDPRLDRHVKVTGYDNLGFVGIAGCSADGSYVSARLTWANPSRFNGKRGGYTRIK